MICKHFARLGPSGSPSRARVQTVPWKALLLQLRTGSELLAQSWSSKSRVLQMNATPLPPTLPLILPITWILLSLQRRAHFCLFFREVREQKVKAAAGMRAVTVWPGFWED